MEGDYLGHLPERDPLSGYLKREIFPQLGCSGRLGIRVFRTCGSNAVYIYEDRQTNRKAVGKFFFSERRKNWEAAERRLWREYRNINEFTQYLDRRCHTVARVLGCNGPLNRLLVVEYCEGERLDSVILRVIGGADRGLLFGKLTALAYFLATVHNRSARMEPVRFEPVRSYFYFLLDSLNGLISGSEKEQFYRLCAEWDRDPAMRQDREVLVHGDATPANFCFGDAMRVFSFDLERGRRTDRLFDLGRLTAELQHFFFRATADPGRAEPFIGHFLWEYCCHFPDRERTFTAITAKLPFYHGMNLLRIARNDYLDHRYRRALIDAAKRCLSRS